MKTSKWALVALIALGMAGLAVADVVRNPTPPPTPTPISGTFTLQVGAVYIPAPTVSTSPVGAQPPIMIGAPVPLDFLTGTGSATATSTVADGVTVDLGALTDKAGTTTAAVTITNPLTRGANDPNFFSGAGTVAVTVTAKGASTTTNLNVTVQGRLVQSNCGTMIVGSIGTPPVAFPMSANILPGPQFFGQFQGAVPPPPPTPITGTFTLNASAAYNPLPGTASANTAAAIRLRPALLLTGKGSGTADATGVSATATLSDKAGSTAAALAFVEVARDTKDPNKFSGAGTVTVTDVASGAVTVLNVTVQGHLQLAPTATGTATIQGTFITIAPAAAAAAGAAPTPAAQIIGQFQGPVTPATTSAATTK